MGRNDSGNLSQEVMTLSKLKIAEFERDGKTYTCEVEGIQQVEAPAETKEELLEPGKFRHCSYFIGVKQ
jgi:hypothetical protein